MKFAALNLSFPIGGPAKFAMDAVGGSYEGTIAGDGSPINGFLNGRDRFYPRGLCPTAEDAFSRWLTIDVLENYTQDNIDEIADGIAKVAYHFSTRSVAVRAR